MNLTLAPLLVAAVWLGISLLRSYGTAMGPDTARRVGAAALVFALMLVLARQIPLAVAMASAGVGILLTRRTATPRGAHASARRPHGGATPSVETAMLRMTLDPTDGSMDGAVRIGPFAGRRLSDMNRHELLSLAAEVDPADAASLRLLSGYLDWRFPDWRDEGDAERAGVAGAMSRREALSVLGLDESADVPAVKKAYRRLMKRVHPDQGGSAELAARVRAAYDRLVG